MHTSSKSSASSTGSTAAAAGVGVVTDGALAGRPLAFENMFCTALRAWEVSITDAAGHLGFLAGVRPINICCAAGHRCVGGDSSGWDGFLAKEVFGRRELCGRQGLPSERQGVCSSKECAYLGKSRGFGPAGSIHCTGECTE